MIERTRAFVNKNFAIKTILAICGLAFCVAFIHFPEATHDKLLGSVFGGFFLGAGIGLSVRGGAVIDGTEVLAIYLSRKLGTTIGDIIIIINIIIITTAVNGGRVTWKSIIHSDNSLVIAVVIAQSASPDGLRNIPWLLLKATSNQGTGAFTDVTFVVRVDTDGGVAPPIDDCKYIYISIYRKMCSSFDLIN